MQFCWISRATKRVRYNLVTSSTMAVRCLQCAHDMHVNVDESLKIVWWERCHAPRGVNGLFKSFAWDQSSASPTGQASVYIILFGSSWDPALYVSLIGAVGKRRVGLYFPRCEAAADYNQRTCSCWTSTALNCYLHPFCKLKITSTYTLISFVTVFIPFSHVVCLETETLWRRFTLFSCLLFFVLS